MSRQFLVTLLLEQLLKWYQNKESPALEEVLHMVKQLLLHFCFSALIIWLSSCTIQPLECDQISSESLNLSIN